MRSMMLTMETREAKLKDFLERLRVLSWTRSEEPDKTLFHIGAIVCADEANVAKVAEEVAKGLSSEAISLPADAQRFDVAVQKTNEVGNSLVVTLSDDLAIMHNTLELLRQIADFNDISPREATKRVWQNPETRFLIVFSKNVWSKQSYPSFIDLFGVVCRLDDLKS